MDTNTITVFLIGVVSLIPVVCFLVLCSNVNHIKKHLKNSRLQHMKAEYYKYLTLDDKEKAYECVLYIIFNELTDPEFTSEERKKRFENLRGQYTISLTHLGKDFPPNPYK